MRKTTIALLILVCAGSAATLSLLLKDQPYRLAGMTACQAYAGACFMPAPSINQLLP
ncbi:hypothetical protein [Pseudomonas sp. 2FE]|uniref:hypothetical protein n=1 Tax=Pseudomonas sp. 2FE TaxID=2502190 RepID=UPI0014859ED7|nr:hypothetical protein [Pseudomonas sp. 2FE]